MNELLFDVADDYLRVLGQAARNSAGNVYVALIPHPDEWLEKGPDDVVAWSWSDSAWEPVL